MRPDRAQRRRMSARQLRSVRRLLPRRQLQARVPELGAAARGERPRAGGPSSPSAVGETISRYGSSRPSRCRLGARSPARRRSAAGVGVGPMAAMRVDAELEARPVEHALDGEGDARLRRHLEDQPAASAMRAGVWPGGSTGPMVVGGGCGWRRAACRDGRIVASVVAALGDRLRLEMDDQEGRLVRRPRRPVPATRPPAGRCAGCALPSAGAAGRPAG